MTNDDFSFPSFREWDDSQLPALRLLRKLGYAYISPAETLAARHGSRSRVLLETVLEEQLRRINRIEYRGEHHSFSPANIRRAVEALRDLQDDGLMSTNEAVFDLLTLGKSMEQEIDGDRKSFTLRYIDWENIGNNVFHVTKEFEVAGPAGDRRPDLVLFVNGIPFVVIECKRRDVKGAIDRAIEQMARNQSREEGIQRLFHYAQLLLAVHPDQVRYAAVGVFEKKFWSRWKEEGLDAGVAPLLVGDGPDGGDRTPNEQDRTLYALCRPERLLELVYRYTLFDKGVKKLARYQQYFAVRRIIERVRNFDPDGHRRGGVVWHTQGSGKSLTMVMFAKALTLERSIQLPKVVLVTDRIDLDRQIEKTFRACGKEPHKAATGAHLLELLETPGVDLITTVIDKFDAALRKRTFTDPSPDIFVLVDESHRSQYGKMHARMRMALPNACYIGFTGTPLMKKEKTTARKFGGIIDRYTIDQAVADGAVVPLLYEGRMAVAEIDQKQIDKGFDRIAEPLNEYQKRDLKKKLAREDRIVKLQQIVEEIARDIEKHYVATYQGTGLKAQLAAPDQLTAIRFHRCFEDGRKIRSAVIISSPDMREGDEDDPVDEKGEVKRFWNEMMEMHGRREDRYLENTIASFGEPDGVELLIVVDKLLVGFDEPRDTVLYIAKRMRDHALLQAIARVNRIYPGKEYGIIIDYRGVLGELDKALGTYRELAEFDPEDVAGAVHDLIDVAREVPQRYSELADIFKGLPGREDIGAMGELLRDEGVRRKFYEKLSAYARTLQLALGSEKFHQEVPADRVTEYIRALRFYQSLRQMVAQLYAEEVDYGEYEGRIRKLLDTHVSVDEVVRVTKLVNVFDTEEFRAEVERFSGSDESKADLIAHRTLRSLSQRMDEDPVLYARFSKMIEQTIAEFQQKRLEEAELLKKFGMVPDGRLGEEYLRRVTELMNQVVSGRFSGVPSVLVNKPEARAYYNVLDNQLGAYRDGIPPEEWRERMAQAGIELQEIIDRNRIVDWDTNPDVERRIDNEVEDYLLDMKRELGLAFGFDDIDLILKETVRIARSHRS